MKWPGSRKTVDYSKPETPKDYKCGGCGATGCKLWREYSTFSPALACAPCAAKSGDRDISTIDADGRRLTPEYDWESQERSDQIGWYVPAIPDMEGVGYWGYTSVPQPGIDWWRKLPTLPQGAA